MSGIDTPLLKAIRESLIGDDSVVPGPFGPRRLVYADYTASGRALSFIEEFMLRQVLPFYGNTHTEASVTGRMTSALREEARRLIHSAVHGGPDDVVLFCGSGSTGAIDKLLRVLDLRLPADLSERYRLAEQIPLAERPVVFVGPYEHHSNELLWRESIATVVPISEDAYGNIDLVALDRALAEHAARPLRIGCFSAASNVTGAITDTDAVSAVLHRRGALAFWDYAAGGSYLPVSMNSTRGDPLTHKDAVFLSPHKFVGGPGATGVLVAKRKLFTNRVPSVPGGGTITYVTAEVHHYTPDIAAREEGGTPDILGAIRAGLAFDLKRALGADALEPAAAFARRALGVWSKHPAIVLLGDLDAPRLPITSFLIRQGDRYLHHNFVATLLSDLFGIQARGGCSCAGPYGHALLGVQAETARGFERQVLAGRLSIKPGWVRLNFAAFFSEAVVDYIIGAVQFVAEHGAQFLQFYDLDLTTGEWSHRSGPAAVPASLQELWRLAEVDAAGTASRLPDMRLGRQLEHARRLLGEPPPRTTPAGPLPPDFEELRWFTLPADLVAAPDGTARSPGNLIEVARGRHAGRMPRPQWGFE